MFSNKDLRNLIVPFFLEQLLMALVGMADVFVVGFLGEAAVSGVSLVNAFNMIFMNLFTVLAAGGAVVISQYIGRKDNRRAGEAASQLLLAAVLFYVAISVVVLLAKGAILRFMFGRVEDDVMAACITYLRISAYSYPALAVLQCRGGPLPQLWKDQHHHVPVHRLQYHQRCGQLYRCVLAPCRCGGGGLALPAGPDVFGGGHHVLLFF